MVFFVELLPERNRHNGVFVLLEHVAMLLAELHEFMDVFWVGLDSLISKLLEFVVFDCQTVASFFLSWIIDVLVSSFRVERNEQVFEVIEFVGGGHLVEDVHFGFSGLLSFFDGQSEALDGVIDIDEGPGLFSCPIESDGVTTSDLRAKAIEECAEIAINVDSVDQVGMHFSFRSTGTPNNSLMKLSDLQTKVFLEVKESDVVETLGHVVNAARVVGVDDLD